MGLFGSKKPSDGDQRPVREDQVRRIRRALDDEETAIVSGQDSALRRARSTMSAAERNATRAEIAAAHRAGPQYR